MARRSRTKAAPQPEVTLSENTSSPVTHENEAEPVEPEPVAPEPDIFDQQIALRQQEKAQGIVADVADSTRMPEQTGFAAQHAPKPFIANPSSKRRESHAASVRKLPSTMTIPAGDLKVKLIDKGDNLAGIGIKVDVPEGRALSEDEKAIIRRHVKGEEGENTGFRWDADVQFWHKAILKDGEFEDQVPPSRPVAIRLDAERRVQQLAEALREHSADPVGYAEMVKQRREQATESARIPD